jgi:selT/selW/selH-like putative selenoprotein
MAEQIFDEFGQAYEVRLIPSRGGVFEVTVDGELVYSKAATGRHADYPSDVAPHLRS